MSILARFKIAFCWRPRPLFAKQENGDWHRVGWVWMQKARLVNNQHHGWIAFVDQQTPEKLQICPACNRPLDGD